MAGGIGPHSPASRPLATCCPASQSPDCPCTRLTLPVQPLQGRQPSCPVGPLCPRCPDPGPLAPQHPWLKAKLPHVRGAPLSGPPMPPAFSCPRLLMPLWAGPGSRAPLLSAMPGTHCPALPVSTASHPHPGHSLTLTARPSASTQGDLAPQLWAPPATL